MFGKWQPVAGAHGGAAETRLIIEGRAAQGAYRSETPAREGPAASSLRHLWARQRIAAFGDQEALVGGSAQKASITELGLQYGLLTSYTSFIAIDHRVRNSNPALGAEADQPLPMPQGVSEAAVGGALGAAVPSTPEPATWAALAVALLMLVIAARVLRRRHA